jgi:hypothetical protein
MGPIDPKGTIGKVILAGMLTCVASWAGLIVLLVRIITSPGDYVAVGVLLAWAALTAVILATRRVPWDGSDWRSVVVTVVLAPAAPLIAAGIYVWQRTQPFRQSRANRARMAARGMHDRRL